MGASSTAKAQQRKDVRKKQAEQRAEQKQYDIYEVQFELEFLIDRLSIFEILEGYGLERTAHGMLHTRAYENGFYSESDINFIKNNPWPNQESEYRQCIFDGQIKEAVIRLVIIEQQIAFEALSKMVYKLKPFPMSETMREEYKAWHQKDDSNNEN